MSGGTGNPHTILEQSPENPELKPLLVYNLATLLPCANNCPGVRATSVITGGGTLILAASLSGQSSAERGGTMGCLIHKSSKDFFLITVSCWLAQQL